MNEDPSFNFHITPVSGESYKISFQEEQDSSDKSVKIGKRYYKAIGDEKTLAIFSKQRKQYRNGN